MTPLTTPRIRAALATQVTAAPTRRLGAADSADGARPATAPPRVTLTFNHAVQQRFSTLTVTDPDGSNHTQVPPAANGGT